MSPSPDRVGGREQAEGRMRPDDPALIEQSETARRFQHALDDEHHVRTAGVILVEAQRDIVLVGPGQDAVPELGDLHALLHHDGVLADEIDPAHMAVQIDANAGPVQTRRDLLDMRRFAGTVVARHHDAAVEGEAGKDRQRRLFVEQIVGIDIRHMRIGFRIGRHDHAGLEAEFLLHRHRRVGQVGDIAFDLVHNVSTGEAKLRR